ATPPVAAAIFPFSPPPVPPPPPLATCGQRPAPLPDARSAGRNTTAKESSTHSPANFPADTNLEGKLQSAPCPLLKSWRNTAKRITATQKLRGQCNPEIMPRKATKELFKELNRRKDRLVVRHPPEARFNQSQSNPAIVGNCSYVRLTDASQFSLDLVEISLNSCPVVSRFAEGSEGLRRTLQGSLCIPQVPCSLLGIFGFLAGLAESSCQ